MNRELTLPGYPAELDMSNIPITDSWQDFDRAREGIFKFRSQAPDEFVQATVPHDVVIFPDQTDQLLHCDDLVGLADQESQ